MFTFDVEEDWVETPFPYYYDSYKYIDAGVIYDLVEVLSERDISATFYITPNVALKRPNILKFLEKNNQRIGLHLHIHNLVKVEYPYHAGKEDEITSYDFKSKISIMKISKNIVESILGHKVVLYRSGRLACDYWVEKAAKIVGFNAISNDRGTFFIRSIKLWNIGTGELDLFSTKNDQFDNLTRLFRARKIRQEVIAFSAHPMLLYDREKNIIRKNRIKQFSDFLTFLLDRNDVEIMEQHKFLDILVHTL